MDETHRHRSFVDTIARYTWISMSVIRIEDDQLMTERTTRPHARAANLTASINLIATIEIIIEMAGCIFFNTILQQHSRCPDGMMQRVRFQGSFKGPTLVAVCAADASQPRGVGFSILERADALRCHSTDERRPPCGGKREILFTEKVLESTSAILRTRAFGRWVRTLTAPVRYCNRYEDYKCPNSIDVKTPTAKCRL